MTAILYQYGPPPTMSALCAMVRQRAEDRMWREYVASMAYCATRAGYKDFPFRPYSEMAQEMRGVKKKRDTRTAEEIRDSVVQWMRGGGDHEAV